MRGKSTATNRTDKVDENERALLAGRLRCFLLEMLKRASKLCGSLVVVLRNGYI